MKQKISSPPAGGEDRGVGAIVSPHILAFTPQGEKEFLIHTKA
jgi:hypothetical protein